MFPPLLCIYESSAPLHRAQKEPRLGKMMPKHADDHADLCAVSNKLICLWPRSFVSSASIYEILPGWLISLREWKTSQTP